LQITGEELPSHEEPTELVDATDEGLNRGGVASEAHIAQLQRDLLKATEDPAHICFVVLCVLFSVETWYIWKNSNPDYRAIEFLDRLTGKTWPLHLFGVISIFLVMLYNCARGAVWFVIYGIKHNGYDPNNDLGVLDKLIGVRIDVSLVLVFGFWAAATILGIVIYVENGSVNALSCCTCLSLLLIVLFSLWFIAKNNYWKFWTFELSEAIEVEEDRRVLETMAAVGHHVTVINAKVHPEVKDSETELIDDIQHNRGKEGLEEVNSVIVTP